MHRMSLITCLFIVATLITPSASAEGPKGPRGDKGARDQLRGRSAELRREVLQRRVGLDEARSAEVQRMLTANDSQRKEAKRAMKKAQRRLRALVELDSDDGPAYAAEVDTMLTARTQLHTLRHKQLRKLRKVLSPKEMGRLLLVLDEMRHHMKGMKGRGDRGGRAHGRRGRRGERGPRARGGRGEHGPRARGGRGERGQGRWGPPAPTEREGEAWGDDR